MKDLRVVHIARASFLTSKRVDLWATHRPRKDVMIYIFKSENSSLYFKHVKLKPKY